MGGHEIKSRALTSIILDNRIFDGPTAGTSYSVDLSDGGVGTICGNTIEKGPQAQNQYIVHFAGEGTYPNSSLMMCDNTIINDRGVAFGLLNQSQDAGGANIPATITGNTFYQLGTAKLFQDANGPPFDIASNNIFDPGPGPQLDTSVPYSVPPLLAPEPSGAALLPLALLVTAMVRVARRKLAGVTAPAGSRIRSTVRRARA